MALEQVRGHWGSRLGFILAAAGSAVGLGNIWRFPYQVGEHGGGLFVLAYLLCIVFIGLPVFISEVFVGRETQNSPVGAFRALTRPGSPWMIVGFVGVAAGFMILSYYSVVAGWCMHYTWLSVTETFAGQSPEQINSTFATLVSNPALSTMWHLIFMAITISIVIAGIKDGIELWVRILMPALFALLLLLLFYTVSLDTFGESVRFIFLPDFSKFSSASILAALGQGLMSLSVGLGAMIVYGSYLQRNEDIVGTSLWVGGLDALVAILGALVIFPVIFASSLDPAGGPGLVFQSLPVAFSTMPGGMLLAPAFFILLTFAALTSAVSLLEIATSYFIDEKGWSRTKAALGTGGIIAFLGIPAALSASSKLFGEEMTGLVGRNWFDLIDYIAASYLLPFGALGIALFVAWKVPESIRSNGFKTGSKFTNFYLGWLFLLRYVVPFAILMVFLQLIGVL